MKQAAVCLCSDPSVFYHAPPFSAPITSLGDSPPSPALITAQPFTHNPLPPSLPAPAQHIGDHDIEGLDHDALLELRRRTLSLRKVVAEVSHMLTQRVDPRAGRFEGRWVATAWHPARPMEHSCVIGGCVAMLFERDCGGCVHALPFPPPPSQ